MINLIFSDVDGCFIGQGPICFTTITEALQRVSESCLVILATGKTAHEIIQLNQHLHLPGPFIVENGHGLLFKRPFYLPSTFSKGIALDDYWLLPLGDIKPDIAVLQSISPLNTLLTEMEDNYLASLTGMSLEEVYVAKQRFFTEPIFIKHLTPYAVKILKKQLANKKLYYVQTSRFLHVTKCFSNKGRAIRFLLQSYFSDHINTTYAIGDSLNDFSMFAHCDNNYYIANQLYDDLPKCCEIIIEKELSGWLKILSTIA